MFIDQKLLDSLTAQAKASPRLRMNLDIRELPRKVLFYASSEGKEKLYQLGGELQDIKGHYVEH